MSGDNHDGPQLIEVPEPQGPKLVVGWNNPITEPGDVDGNNLIIRAEPDFGGFILITFPNPPEATFKFNRTPSISPYMMAGAISLMEVMRDGEIANFLASGAGRPPGIVVARGDLPPNMKRPK